MSNAILLLPNRSPSIPLDLLEALGQRLARHEGAFWGQMNWQQQRSFIWDAERRIQDALNLLSEDSGWRHNAPQNIRDMQLLVVLLSQSRNHHSAMEGNYRAAVRRFAEQMGVF